MPNALVIADDPVIRQEIEKFLNVKMWPHETIGMHALIANGSTGAEKYRCMIMAIDGGFRKQFCGLMTELMPLVRNCSAKSRLYLLVESESAPDLGLWRPHITQTLMLDGKRAALQQALDNIMQLEWRPVPATAFVSPTQGE